MQVYSGETEKFDAETVILNFPSGTLNVAVFVVKSFFVSLNLPPSYLDTDTVYLIPFGLLRQDQLTFTISDFISCSFPFFASGGEVIAITGFASPGTGGRGEVAGGKLYFETSTLETERAKKEPASNFSLV